MIWQLARSLKKLKKLLKLAEWLESTTPIPANDGFSDWCQDETRMDLKTIQIKKYSFWSQSNK